MIGLYSSTFPAYPNTSEPVRGRAGEFRLALDEADIVHAVLPVQKAIIRGETRRPRR